MGGRGLNGADLWIRPGANLFVQVSRLHNDLPEQLLEDSQGSNLDNFVRISQTLEAIQ